MSYIEGYAAPVPDANREIFAAQARDMAVLLRAAGAEEVIDAWGVDVPDGEVTSFPLAVELRPGETVAFGWIRWPSKAVRDAGWDMVMADPAMQAFDPGFDGKRMIFGGFEPVA